MTTRRVKSRKQPSLPGFPEMPERITLNDIAIPNMPMWEQIDGDMDLAGHGGTIATADGDHIELLKIQPVREYVGDREAAEVGFPFWTREAWFDLEDLDPNSDDVKSALQSIGMDQSESWDWFVESTPEQRALTIASALFDYGRSDEGPAGWSEDLPDYEVKRQNGKVINLRDYLSSEDDEFRNDVLGYSDIRSKLEEIVEQMTNESSAQAWSTVDDQAADDAEKEGFDPNSLVGVAEFGDAVAVNGDVETEKTFAGVLSELEAEGYVETDVGGKVPAQEGYADPESVIRAVARDMDVDEDVVEEAAKGLDWWPKESGHEIASPTSGWAVILGKKSEQSEGDTEERRRPRRRVR